MLERALKNRLSLWKTKNKGPFRNHVKTLTTSTNMERKAIVLRGKEVMLKAVALAILSYAMSCFKLPTTLCSELERLMTNFCFELVDKRGWSLTSSLLKAWPSLEAFNYICILGYPKSGCQLVFTKLQSPKASCFPLDNLF